MSQASANSQPASHHAFQPLGPDPAGIVSWAHIGDLHMTLPGQQNHLDLLAIVDQLNQTFRSSLAFVFLPGDVADAGSVPQYEIVRQALDTLQLPWCAILGDHDVHEKSFANFTHFMSPQTRYDFTSGPIRFFALNAFDLPDPGSFILLSDQLVWLEHGLQSLTPGQSAVLFLHCYPSDLKQGGGELRDLLAHFPIRLVEMGHTHYNEVANDGRTLYAATRSTGQIEEGPVGFSITSLDGPVLSWKFLPLGELPALIITSPSDERFLTTQNAPLLAIQGDLPVRAKTFSNLPVREVTATLGQTSLPLNLLEGSSVWEGTLPSSALTDGVHTLSVTLTDTSGRHATDEIRIAVGPVAHNTRDRHPRDQDNPLAPWPAHGLLGTQLGPNKNGKKW